MKQCLCLYLACMLSVTVMAQQGVSIGTGNPPDPSAILDLQSTQKGFLTPRLTTTQRNAIVSPAIGLMVYNTTTSCLQVYMPQTGWRDVTCDCQNSPSSAFTFPGSIAMGSPAQFNATQGGLTYSWTFTSGTPATSTSQTPSVTWATPGTYAVTLTVTDQQGCTSTTTQNVTVQNCVPGTITFSYTGGAQTWVVPPCVNSIQVDARGAQGEQANGTTSGWSSPGVVNIPGAMGGRVQATLTVTPGETLYIYVGAAGANGGFNGGGGIASCGGTEVIAGRGGGASDIRRGGQALNNRILVAGGGGGAAGNANTYNSTPGIGGGLIGGNAITNTSSGACLQGQGGTQSTGGATGNNTCWCGTGASGNAGLVGVGGSSVCAPSGLSTCSCSGTGCVSGGGGGGGYYGGGSGIAFGAGGGGSSYVTVVGSSNITHTQGTQTGNGVVTIVY